MRYRQTGPAFKTLAWKKVYGTWRNVIETRNDYVKNNRGGAAIGDHTRRPVRGFAAAFFYTALGVVAANVSMIRRFLAGWKGMKRPRLLRCEIRTRRAIRCWLPRTRTRRLRSMLPKTN